MTLAHLRHHAVARTLFAPTTLRKAVARLGFVQADPIRAPARAQDLVLRHRVKGYRAGDLERRYPELDIEEDFFVNYGFLPRTTQALMHPRTARKAWSRARWVDAGAVLDFVRELGVAHPREVDAKFAHGKVTNWFGGSSNATTHLLDEMHYRGLLRVARREGGTRLYSAREAPPEGATPVDPATALDALVDVIVGKYAPLPAASLGRLVSQLRGATPQWIDGRAAALARAKKRLPHVSLDGVTWYWPEGESPSTPHPPQAEDDAVRLLAPFDPIVWDRARFETLWGWVYRFEAYTPAPKRVRGYYALPLLWRDHVIGWGNVAVREGALDVDLGYVAGRAPRAQGFRHALEEELERMRGFLSLAHIGHPTN